MESLTSEPVVQDLDEGTVLVCVTEHPGFNAVCLQKWSLRLALINTEKRIKKHTNRRDPRKGTCMMLYYYLRRPLCRSLKLCWQTTDTVFVITYSFLRSVATDNFPE